MSQPPPQLALRVGHRATFRLGGRGAAGYRWTAAAQPSGLLLVELHPAETAPAAAGSVDTIVTIDGLRPGRATIELELRRPFGDRRMLRSYRIEVDVSA